MRDIGSEHWDRPDVWKEFRRRRVIRVVVSYVAIGFAVIEAVWLVLGRVAAPPWTDRAILGVLVLGFPVAVVLAWTYDVTPRGIVRTPEKDGEGEEQRDEALPGWRWWFTPTAALLLGLAAHSAR